MKDQVHAGALQILSLVGRPESYQYVSWHTLLGEGREEGCGEWDMGPIQNVDSCVVVCWSYDRT
jgi:hypothetical protein